MKNKKRNINYTLIISLTLYLIFNVLSVIMDCVWLKNAIICMNVIMMLGIILIWVVNIVNN